MRFAVSLLSVLGIASIIGTVLKQNEPYENYIIKFGQFWFEVFLKLGLYDVYHALWFLLILLFLVTSTSLCIYRNAPLMIKEWKVFKEHATEKSLRAFSHQATFNPSGTLDSSQNKISQYLVDQGYTYKVAPQDNGDMLLAAKIGTHQRLGYILTHAAIVIICFGGILDGNLPFKIQEMLGHKKIEVLDIPSSQVPEVSRLSTNNPSFRANMTLPEGTSASVAFVRVRDGYLVQDLPFRVALKDFRIEHYETGQPKSFESDIVIIDPDVKKPIEKTISVNHPFVYKGIAIYQSDFQDGGSTLNFKVWDMATPNAQSYKVDGVVAKKGTLGQGDTQLTVEFNEFRKFNIINLSPDGKGKPHNVGPNTTYKLRDTTGQAREYVTYMQPLKLDGKAYFVSGMRETVQEDFKYLRIPADDDFSIDGFMYLRSYMMNPAHFDIIAKRLSEKSVAMDSKLQAQFEASIKRLLETFKADGFTALSKLIESSVPEKDRQNAADAYFKLLSAATFEAYNLSLAERNKPAITLDKDNFSFLQDSLNAMNDYFYFGTPYYFQLENYVQREASGFQLTKSPGQKWVYLGSVLLVLGIFAMFYIRERRVWILLKASGEEVLLAMSSNRKNLDFDQDFDRIRTQLKQVLS
jgi:cytochrome c biogenesis protein